MQRTLCLIKPDAVQNYHIGDIIRDIEGNCMDLKIAEMKKFWFSYNKASKFYAEHEGKPFFDGLIGAMTAGPCVGIVLEGPGAIQKWRDWIGPTDPRKGSLYQHLRARYGSVGARNALHGSDSMASAEREINLVFPEIRQKLGRAILKRAEHLIDVDASEQPFRDPYNGVIENLSDTPRVLFKKLDPDARLPERAHASDAGWDLFAIKDAIVRHGAITVVPTGLSMALPEGWEAQVRARSGLAFKEGISVVNGPGTIDAGFRGAVNVCLTRNVNNEPYEIKAGDRIAQLVFQRVPQVEVVDVSNGELPTDIGRGTGGYGSTGR